MPLYADPPFESVSSLKCLDSVPCYATDLHQAFLPLNALYVVSHLPTPPLARDHIALPRPRAGVCRRRRLRLGHGGREYSDLHRS